MKFEKSSGSITKSEADLSSLTTSRCFTMSKVGFVSFRSVRLSFTHCRSTVSMFALPLCHNNHCHWYFIPDKLHHGLQRLQKSTNNYRLLLSFLLRAGLYPPPCAQSRVSSGPNADTIHYQTPQSTLSSAIWLWTRTKKHDKALTAHLHSVIRYLKMLRSLAQTIGKPVEHFDDYSVDDRMDRSVLVRTRTP